jgi:murein DD-endopeptidase MepM/ murein hydrolase activator NlpD
MRKLAFILTSVMLLLPVSTAQAQDAAPSGPIYIVQDGDNITTIASQFGITVDELITANNISNANLLAVGDELIIPGLQGVTGYLVTEKVGFGSSLNSLAIQNRVPRQMLSRLNRLTSPTELYTGVSLIIPQDETRQKLTSRFILNKGQSLLEFAVLSGLNPWQLSSQNQLTNSSSQPAGSILYLPDSTRAAASLQSLPLGDVTISPLPLVQGKTISITIPASENTRLSGSLTNHPLHFFPDGNGNQVSLQGIHAMQEPGIYPLTISLELSDGSTYTQEQMVIVQDGHYGQDPVILVQDDFIDPAITQPELDWLTSVTAPASPQKMWNGVWFSPSPYAYQDCLNSRYGNRRSYNGGPFEFFHTGVDFCGGELTNIYAPAAGTVVFAGPLTVRGNATIIDHGWGVYTGYWHQNQINVKTGDVVTPGQVIGLVGSTGRVTGAHLHWEVWAGGVQVSPLDWLEKQYP